MKGLLVIVLLLVTEGIAQPPEILWTSGLRGRGDWLDIINTRDGGYAVCSMVWPDDGRRFGNMMLQKADSLGQPQWLRFYTQSDSNDVRNATGGRALRQMPDNGFILAGGYDAGTFIVRTDSLANVLWMKILPRGEFGILWAEDCEIGDDGNIVVVGDDRAVKLNDNAEGEVIWAKSYDIGGGEHLSTVLNALNGGYLLLGTTYSIDPGDGNMYAVRIDEDGEIVWRRGYGTDQFEGCTNGIRTIDGGWCLVGTQVFVDNDTCYAAAIRLTADGEEVWQRIYSQYRTGNYFMSVAQTSDSGFVFGGHDGTASCFLLIRTDPEGEALWRGRYLPRGNCISIFIMDDGGYVLGGDNGGPACLIRTKPDTTHVNNVVALIDPAFPSQVVVGAPYPNPFNSTTTIRYSGGLETATTRLAVYGLDGRLVAEFDPPYPPCNSRGGLQTVLWNAAGVPAGQYIIKLANGNYSATKTVTLIK